MQELPFQVSSFLFNVCSDNGKARCSLSKLLFWRLLNVTFFWREFWWQVHQACSLLIKWISKMQNLKIIFFRSYLALEVLLVLFPVTFSSGFTFFSRRLALASTTCDYNGIFLKFLTALEVINYLNTQICFCCRSLSVASLTRLTKIATDLFTGI